MFRRSILAAACAILSGLTALADPATPVAVWAEVELSSGHTLLTLDRAAIARAASGVRQIRFESLPLGDELVDLSLEPFRVLAPDATIMVVDEAGERSADFDPASVSFWRGSVDGAHGSHVFLSVADGSVVGRIELGAGQPTFAISSEGGDLDAGGVALDEGQVVVFRANASGYRETAPIACGVGITPIGPPGELPPPSTNGPATMPTPAVGTPVLGMRMARLAVESDYAMYQLFDSERDALTYLIQLYAVSSDILVRDTALRFDIASLRLWTTPDEPYASGVGRPVVPDGVDVDFAQLMSGRKDAPSGGLAYGICARSSWVGYGIGMFTDPSTPNVFNQDIAVVVHELGHSAGTRHTHDYRIDECDDVASQPRRGTIMSYCATTFTGGSALRDMHLHRGVRGFVRSCVDARLPLDCNQNGVDDDSDIAAGRSTDANANGVPDECEDCNDNGVLDDADIASGTSSDHNGNGIPDECEPDCNDNGRPDDVDIALLFSMDENGDTIPDECQADRDGEGRFDWVQIVADMSLDLDRDAVLDATQDCDDDGVPDVVALNHAFGTWTADPTLDLAMSHHFQTGVLRSVSVDGLLNEPLDVLITPTRRVLVTSAGDGRIAEFDLDGAFVGDLVATGAGGLTYPTALTIAPSGDLLVADRDGDAVRRYDLQTGAPLGDLVPSGADGLDAPYAITIGPNGNVYVGTDAQGVFEYDGTTGAFVRRFVQPGAGGIGQSRGILFIPGMEPDTSRFLIADMAADAILEFDAATGDPAGQFSVGTWRGRFANPWGLRLGPDGRVYASIHEAESGSSPLLFPPTILGFDGQSGGMFRALVAGVDALAQNPAGFDFVPGDGLDCNLNQIPDACDIADGRSADRNANGVPDECESLCQADCDGDGRLTLFDFLCFQNAFDSRLPFADCTGDGEFDLFDFLCFQNVFAGGCP
ncbi:MAG: M12 family metallo-peptidase [Phycisphaerales bacterium]